MSIGKPIPENADYEDPRWVGSFHDLAAKMISFDAKTKIIVRYTGIPAKTISRRYKLLTGRCAPAGRSQTFDPERFIFKNHRIGVDWNIQAAAYVGIYLKIESAMEQKVNRGWLLTAAYQAYERLTEKTRHASPKTEKLTFNRAYDLMNSFGHGISRKLSSLCLRTCVDCQSGYLSANSIELNTPHCPVCELERKYMLMSDYAKQMTVQRKSGLKKAQM